MIRIFFPLFLLLAILAGIVGYQYHASHMQAPALKTGTWLTARPITPFALTDNQHQAFTDQNFLNHWTVLFFGYTHCPDICPTTLALLNQARKKIPDNAPLQIVFISIDPERDDLNALNTYIHFYNPEFKAATGTAAQITQLTKNLGIVYVKVPNAQSPQDYVVDHSGALVVVNPKGEYQALFTPPFNPDTLAADLTKIAQLSV